MNPEPISWLSMMHMDWRFFLLGQNFLRAYNALVDLTSIEIVVRAPAKPVWHLAHAQMSDRILSSTVVLDQGVVLQPFERNVLRAKVATSDLEAFGFRNGVVNFATPTDRVLKNTIFVEDTIATVGETGFFNVSVGNRTSNALDDIVIATETVEDHMVRLREVFECLREAGFKMTD